MNKEQTQEFLKQTFTDNKHRPRVYGFNDYPQYLHEDITDLRYRGSLEILNLLPGIYLYKRSDAECTQAEMTVARHAASSLIETYLMLKLTQCVPGHLTIFPIGVYGTQASHFTTFDGVYSPNLNITFKQLILLISELPIAHNIYITDDSGSYPLSHIYSMIHGNYPLETEPNYLSQDGQYLYVKLALVRS